jgi:hypothetical protein
LFRRPNVTCLAILVATTQKQHDLLLTPDQVKPISRPVIDPQFAYAATNRFHIAKIATLQPPDPHKNMLLCLPVAHTFKPLLKSLGLVNAYHTFHIRDILEFGKGIADIQGG